MTHRDPHVVAQQLSDFMTQDAACKQAAKCLGKGVEIAVRIADTLECAFFKTIDGAALEVRNANSPDVIFILSPTAVDILATQKAGKNLGELGVEVLKLILAGEVHIRAPGSLFSIMKNGYLGIIKEAGIPFAKFLAENGVNNLTKLPEIIKKLKSKS